MRHRAGICFALLILVVVSLSCNGDNEHATDSGTPDALAADAGGPDAAQDGSAAPDLGAAGMDDNPLVPAIGAFPFPSDYYLVKDSTTATGRRVKIPQSVLPSPATSKAFADADGFSRIPAILAHLPGGIDPKSLPSLTDPSQTVTTASAVQLVEAKTWTHVPVLAEVDMTDTDAKRRALIVRPLKLLKPATGYVVILTDKLKAVAGTAHTASAAFAALRDGTPHADPRVTKQREDFKLVREAITGLSLDPKKVVLAWGFHTASETSMTRTLLAVQRAASKATLTAPTIKSDKVETGSRTNRQIVASMTVPDYVAKDGTIKLNASGEAVAQGTREVSFGVTVPSTVTSKRPVIVYGHGFLGWWNQGTRGTWNEIATANKWVTVCTNIGMHQDVASPLTAALTANYSKLTEVVSEVAQSMANNTILARLAAGPLTTLVTGKDSSGNTLTLLDKDNVHYHGVSNGGTFGFLFAATSPVLSRASIIVGGGGLTHFLQRAVQWNDFSAALNVLHPDPRTMLLLMSLSQGLIDPIDPITYVEHLVDNRFSGLKPLTAAIHMAVNDSQVNNLVTEWMARSAGIPLITPSAKSIYGLKTITAPAPGGAPAGTKAALFVYDEKVTPSPVTNVPPAQDNKTHGTVRKLNGYRSHVATFLESGKFVQVCTGPCDPE